MGLKDATKENSLSKIEQRWARTVMTCDGTTTKAKTVKLWPLRDKVKLASNRKSFGYGYLNQFYKKQTGASKLGACPKKKKKKN